MFGQSGFGQSSIFGQPNPAATPAFGQQPNAGFGAPASAPAFGAAQPAGFGQPANTGFGAPAPAFGSASSFGQPPSGFGQPSTFNSGAGTSSGQPAFGSTATAGGGLFGAKPAASVFGSASGAGFGAANPAFGGAAAPTASGFGGGTLGGFGNSSTQTTQNSNNGTGNPSYAATSEKEQNTSTSISFQSINAMPAYRNWSFEELRVQDYVMGKKHAGAVPNSGAAGAAGFGQSAFGAAVPSAFGAAAPATPFGAAPSAFGATTPSAAGFGAAPAPAFGAAAATPGFGGGAASTGGFGASAFGGGTSAFGGAKFGATTPTTNTTFGGTPAAASAFGSAAAAKPAFGFAPAVSAAPATPFGAAAATPFGQATAASGLFGAKPATGFGAAAATPTPATPFGAQTAAGGLFGTATPAFGGAFGAAATSAPAAGSLFAAPATATPGLFGAAPAASAGTGLFGAATPAAAPAAGGLFGAAASSSNLFGAKPAGFGLAATAAPSTGLFGAPAAGTTGGLFGTGLGLGAAAAPALAAQPAAPALQASIDKAPYGNLPLFQGQTAGAAMAQGPSAVEPLIQSKKEKPAFTPHFKLTPKSMSKIKLRGFVPSPSTKLPSNKPSGAADTASLGHFDLSSNRDTLGEYDIDSTFAPRSRKQMTTSRVKSPSNSAQSVRVRFDPSIDTTSPFGTLRVRHDGGSQADDDSVNNTPSKPPSAPRGALTSPSFESTDPNAYPEGDQNNGSDAAVLEDSDDYYVYSFEPDLSELLDMSDDELRQVSEFKVIHDHFGELQFLDTVDLLDAAPNKKRSGIASIVDNVVIFRLRECEVYPDNVEKAPIGQGLNVPARISLKECWPVDKSTREYVKDPQDPRFKKHLTRIKNQPDTKFIHFDIETGVWTFEVEHFSKYGLGDDDDDDDGNGNENGTGSDDQDQNGHEVDNGSGRAPSRRDHRPRDGGSAPLGGSAIDMDGQETDDIQEATEPFADLVEDSTELTEPTQESVFAEDSFASLKRRIGRFNDTPSSSVFESFGSSGFGGLGQLEQSVAPSAIAKRSNRLKAALFKASPKDRPSATGTPFHKVGDKRKAPFSSTHGDGDDDSQSADLLSFSARALRDAESSEASTLQPPPSSAFLSLTRNIQETLKAVTESGLLPRDKSIQFKHSGESPVAVRADAGLSFGRPFRAGWGPGGEFVQVGRLTTSRGKSFSQVTVHRIRPFGTTADASDAQVQRHQRCLETLLCHTDLDPVGSASRDQMAVDHEGTDAAAIPHARLSRTQPICFQDFVELTATKGTIPSIFDREEQILWELCESLWDELGPVHEQAAGLDGARATVVLDGARREKISQWLKRAISTTMQQDLSKINDSVRHILVHLVNRQIGSAVRVAVDSKHFRLAALMAQIGGAGSRVALRNISVDQRSKSYSGHGVVGSSQTAPGVRALLAQQINSWTQSANDHSSSVVGQELDHVYRLLTGDVAFWKPSLYSCLSNWRQAFGLFFWYAQGGSLKLEDCIGQYEATIARCNQTNASIPEPLPSYASKQQVDISTDRPKDVCFHLLKYYLDTDEYPLELALKPENLGPHSLDRRLSWLLSLILGNLKSRVDLPGHFNALTEAVMFELESIGLWQWSLFVAMFMDSPLLVENAVRTTLARYYRPPKHFNPCDCGLQGIHQEPDPIDHGVHEQETNLWNFVVNRIGVPKALVYEAWALFARYNDNSVAEAEYLIHAGDFVGAHYLIVTKLAPVWIIQENFEPLKTFLNSLESKREGVDGFEDWDCGGGLILAYIEHLERSRADQTLAKTWALAEAKENANAILERLARAGEGFGLGWLQGGKPAQRASGTSADAHAGFVLTAMSSRIVDSRATLMTEVSN
ncbi:uncharacterized protein BJ171DRAFT_63509 [Polychytrium aggregatum]|uniref:uncharacterized protein n=1 Tax=Polychytrium aggregatum TaxID=110093 RepID=UPI0022FE730A|nr:uncharacterized protein BJ171DRAFT_63509 [Polychytrium aggregatum]KAI9205611.1 hypothetical protein BJ171DRAFT_63509 [Polychytrium aggregatum]